MRPRHQFHFSGPWSKKSPQLPSPCYSGSAGAFLSQTLERSGFAADKTCGRLPMSPQNLARTFASSVIIGIGLLLSSVSYGQEAGSDPNLQMHINTGNTPSNLPTTRGFNNLPTTNDWLLASPKVSLLDRYLWQKPNNAFFIQTRFGAGAATTTDKSPSAK